MKFEFGEDPRKWRIYKFDGQWYVRPPTKTFWGVTTCHHTAEPAFADFRLQTEHIRESIHEAAPPLHISL